MGVAIRRSVTKTGECCQIWRKQRECTSSLSPLRVTCVRTMPEVQDPFRPDPEARQFTIRRLLVLALLCALIAGTGQVLELPPSGQVFFTFWWMALAAYLVFRLPYAIHSLLGRTSRWKRLRAHRAELEKMVVRKRQTHRKHQGDDVGG